MIEVDAARPDAGAGEQIEKLAAPAADVEHVGGAGEERQIALQPRADVLARAAKLVLEAHVLVAVERCENALALGAAPPEPLPRPRWELLNLA